MNAGRGWYAWQRSKQADSGSVIVVPPPSRKIYILGARITSKPSHEAKKVAVLGVMEIRRYLQDDKLETETMNDDLAKVMKKFFPGWDAASSFRVVNIGEIAYLSHGRLGILFRSVSQGVAKVWVLAARRFCVPVPR